MKEKKPKWALTVIMPMEPDDPPEKWGAVSVGPFDDEIDANLFPIQHLDQSGRPFRKFITKLLDPTKM